jgi:hypothetical protein
VQGHQRGSAWRGAVENGDNLRATLSEVNGQVSFSVDGFQGALSSPGDHKLKQHMDLWGEGHGKALA